MKQIILIAFTLLFARTTQSALPRDKFLTKDGQGGFVGITGLIWTVRPDGSWDRKRFINRTMHKGRLAGQIDCQAAEILGGYPSACAGG